MERADFSNRTFDEIEVGASASAKQTLTGTDVEALALVAGDVDSYHVEPGHRGGAPVVQAAAVAALVAGLVNRKLPGPGTRIAATNMRYAGELRAGDAIETTVTVASRDPGRHALELVANCVNQQGVVLADGTLTVEAPLARVRYTDVATPDIALRHGDGFVQLFARCEPLAAVVCAVVHPCDPMSLRGAIEAARRNLIVPVLVGPEARIRAVAAAEDLDVAPYRIVGVEHSHAAADRAVSLARSGDVDALAKGSLHTDELMAAVVAADGGLRTGRRISHVFVMDVPTHPRLLLITDAAINIEPDLDDKADICRNAIDLAHVLGIRTPHVAVLSAVESVNAKIRSTLDAAALCKMADRGQITGGVLDGPLAFDNAISVDAARAKGIVSPVAGHADILVVPSLEAGNMLAKQLQYLAGADAGGIVLGARVPIALTSRADSVRSRLASAALLKLVAHARREGTLR